MTHKKGKKVHEFYFFLSARRSLLRLKASSVAWTSFMEA
jgi:hypothetical protein